jgi:dethiobiotin synthetase
VSRGVFVTGTDTGVGKTLAACALIHALRTRGLRAVPMKPFAAGASPGAEGRLVNDDTLHLLAAAGLDASWAEVVTPVVLRDALAPHIAAAREARALSLEPIVQALPRLYAAGDFVVVEGVGGFKVPLGDGLDTVDLARELAFPVVLVVGLRLGCLNHALLSADAIRAAGLRLAGWIGNAVDPGMAARDENVDALRARLGAPLLGVLAHAAAPDARELARSLDCAPLLA